MRWSLSLRRFLAMITIISVALGLIISLRRGHLKHRAAYHAEQAAYYLSLSQEARYLADVASGAIPSDTIQLQRDVNASTLKSTSDYYKKKAEAHRQYQREYENRWW